MNILSILSFLIVGILGGILSGLLGIGGGAIFIPLQIFIYTLEDIPTDLQIKMAIGTSLVAIFFGSLFAGLFQAKRGAVVWNIVYRISFGLILGSFIGSFLAEVTPSRVLEIVFGVFELSLGILFFLKKTTSSKESPKKIPPFLLHCLGMGIGAASALLGVGGGFFSVPTLVHFQFPMKKAIGTSSVIGAIASFFGSLTFLFSAFQGVSYQGAIGYLYFPALIPIAIGSLFSVKFGVQLSHRLPQERLKKIFGLILVAVGIFMIVR